MKYTKIQTDLLKILDKGSATKLFYQEDEEKVYLCDSIRLFIIPQEHFFINFKKFNRDPTDLKKLLHPEDSEESHFNGEIRLLSNGKTVRKIEGKEKHAWIDEKLLKDFGNITGYGIKDEKSPVYLYEDEVLLGIVFPIRV